jgi:hypothetical protein
MRSPPDAEFLFASGDSTYWVKSGDNGVRVRSAPILITEVDGRFYEIFVAEDGVDYEDAAFAVARVYARDVLQADSIVLFDDGSVMQTAEAWKKQHPSAEPLDPQSEELPMDPATVVAEEIEILDVHGPYVTLNHLLDMDVSGGNPHRHVGRRQVVDVRTGQVATLTGLFGAVEAKRVLAEGRALLTQLTDSIRAAPDERAAEARETLDSFRFDSLSFGITDIGRAPAIAFMVPGNGIDGEALAINLPPIAVATPSWWKPVQPTLPEWLPDSTSVQWTRGTYTVVAQPNTDGDALALFLVRGTGAKETQWPVATVPIPAYQLVSLDTPNVSPEIHSALARAFDESAMLGGIAQSASRRGAAVTQPLRLMATQFRNRLWRSWSS